MFLRLPRTKYSQTCNRLMQAVPQTKLRVVAEESQQSNPTTVVHLLGVELETYVAQVQEMLMPNEVSQLLGAYRRGQLYVAFDDESVILIGPGAEPQFDQVRKLFAYAVQAEINKAMADKKLIDGLKTLEHL